MSYQALARKWRPRRFADLVGQRHVVQALDNAITKERLHHAYLFSGTRGVGKTTVARIFAKCLNCEQGITATPCGVCSACQEIDGGRFIDLLEVDAASRTKVDQTRELLDNVPYAPARGRYKIYLIDEVHMFSTSSFNALLKTLEEPPPHVKFLLATTDPQKLPVTVLSRCLQFNLKRLLPEEIRGQLAHILTEEAIPFEAGALYPLAQAADGSMRDGLSLLDQAIAYGGGQIREAEVRIMLGSLARDLVLTLVEALARNNAAQVLEIVTQMAEQSPNFFGVLQELLSLLHQIALGQVVPELVKTATDIDPRIQQLTRTMPAADVQLFYQIGLLGQRDLELATDPRVGLEMVLLRMLAFRPANMPATRKTSVATTSQSIPNAAPVVARHQPPSPPMATLPANVGGAASATPIRLTSQADWLNLVRQIGLSGLAQQLAINCQFSAWDGKTLQLQLDTSTANLRTPSIEERLVKALQSCLGPQSQVKFTVTRANADMPTQQEASERAERQRMFEKDQVVRNFKDTFQAQVVPDSIRVLDN